MAEKRALEEESATEGVLDAVAVKRVRAGATGGGDPAPQSSPVVDDDALLPTTSLLYHDDDGNVKRTTQARVGSWLVPEMPEREPESIDIALNGDVDETDARVQEYLRQRRMERSRRREAEEVAAATAAAHAASSSSQASKIDEEEVGTAPIESTPPAWSIPPSSAARRSSRRPAPPPRELVEETPPAKVASATIDPTTYTADLATLMDASDTRALLRMVQASTSIPGFLRPELIAFVQQQANESDPTTEQSRNDSSGSQTQDDGYLYTKSAWRFELGTITKKTVTSAVGDVASGMLASSTDDGKEIEVLVLAVSPSSAKYELQCVDSRRLRALRSDVSTNPWFDANGQPYSVTYRLPGEGVLNSSSGYASLVTQQTAPSQDASVASLMMKERQELISERDQLQHDIRAARAAEQSVKEQATLLRQLYDDAARSAAEAEEKVARLEGDNKLLQGQIDQGLLLIRSGFAGRIEELERARKQAEDQVAFLFQQNALTNDAIRRKAALWDAREAEEEDRRQDLARRQAKRDEERRALQESFFGVSAANAAAAGPTVKQRPHEMFLAVDVDREKIDVDSLQRNEEQALEAAAARMATARPADDADADDDDDELAALQREAALFAERGGDAAIESNVDAPRSSRRTARREGAGEAKQATTDGASRAAAAAAAAAAARAGGGETTIYDEQMITDSISDAQAQAQLAALDGVEDELAAFAASFADHADGDAGEGFGLNKYRV